MNCPNCQEVMYSNAEPISGLIPDHPDWSVLRLHCHNKECPAIKKGFIPHMKVHCPPDQKWICDEYHLPFQYKEKWFAMVGEPFQGYLGYPVKPNNLFGNVVGSTASPPVQDKQTTVYEIIERTYSLYGNYMVNPRGILGYTPARNMSGETVTVSFIPLSTDNDMHEHAHRLFNRLVKLVVFS